MACVLCAPPSAMIGFKCTLSPPCSGDCVSHKSFLSRLNLCTVLCMFLDFLQRPCHYVTYFKRMWKKMKWPSMMITLSHLGLRNYVFFVLPGVMCASAWLFIFFISSPIQLLPPSLGIRAQVMARTKTMFPQANIFGTSSWLWARVRHI